MRKFSAVEIADKVKNLKRGAFRVGTEKERKDALHAAKAQGKRIVTRKNGTGFTVMAL